MVMAQLKEKYDKEIKPALCQEFQYKNIMQAPKVTKIIINMGVGEAIQNPKVLDFACENLAQITGQKPVVTRAKKSIAGFKLRKGMAIGCQVTLRGSIMYEFLHRLVSVALPRIRDFKGLPDKSFDGRGNYNFGLTEQVIFPEIEYDKIDKLRGMNISITTTARTDEEARSLLAKFGMPFSKRKE
jgi:large subunit ribosomal protein L5